MRNMLLAGACGLLVSMPAASALAQVTSVVTGQSIFVGNPDFSAPFNPYSLGPLTPVGSSATQLSPNPGEGGAPDYNSYQVSTAVTPSDIEFANGATQLGSLTATETATSVQITLKNTGSTAVTPTLQSDILPGGFGVYVGDPNLNPTFDHSTGVTGDALQTPEAGPNLACCGPTPTLDQLASSPGNFSSVPVPGFADAIAGATFSFMISNNGVVVKDITGSLTITYATTAAGRVPVVTLSPDAAAALSNFRLLTSPTDPYAIGYQWDASSLSVDLGGSLAPGDSDVVSYDTAVTAYTFAGMSETFMDADGYQSFPTLLAYSGFGDPIGMGGGGSKPKAVGDDADPVGIQDVYFPLFQVGVPTFDSSNGDLSLPVSDEQLPALPLTYMSAPAVPEPQTWALLLAGMVGVGLGLRRRTGRRLA